MKINNITSDHAVGRMRGRNLGPRAAPGAVSVTDGTTDVPGVAEFVFPAGVVSELADGVAQIGVGAMLQKVTNASGADLVAGDVVVIDTSGNIVTTTTAQDTRPVGIVQAPIANGDDGPIAFSGYVPLVNVTASVTAGHYAETSTTAKKATENTTRRTGSFAYFVTGGTTPTAILFGVPDTTGTGGGGGGATGWYNIKDYGALGNGTTDDRAAAQAAEAAAHAAGGGVVYAPAGSYKFGSPGLVHYPENALLGDGAQVTFFLAGANSMNVVTASGVAADSAYEADHGPQVSGIEFGANAKTGCIGLSLIGVDFQNVSQCIFRGFTGNGTTGGIGLHYYGSLQGVTYDCKFLSNTVGIRYEAVSIGYWGSSLPPARVRVDWCFFYLNASHAIDWSGGQAIYITDSEFDVNGTAADATTSAIKIRMAGDSHGLGLVGRGLWLETNHGNAVVDLGGTVIGEHSLTDCWLAYNDSTYSISLDGSSAAQTLVASQVRHDAITVPSTVSTWRSAGGTTYLAARECDGSTSGTWTGLQFEATTWSGTFGPPNNSNIWRPVVDGAGALILGSGEAVMAYGPA